jgi:hypothetical protein
MVFLNSESVMAPLLSLIGGQFGLNDEAPVISLSFSIGGTVERRPRGCIGSGDQRSQIGIVEGYARVRRSVRTPVSAELELWCMLRPEFQMRSLLLVALSLVAQSPARAPAIDDVAWLTGCWEYTSGARIVEEHWLAPRARTMMNAGRTTQGDKLIEFETVIIREQEGRLAYEAHPSGQPSAVFLSQRVADREVVFENLQHDFPQRVGYKRDGDSLVGWIEGPRNGQTRRIEFPYHRVACASNEP